MERAEDYPVGTDVFLIPHKWH